MNELKELNSNYLTGTGTPTNELIAILRKQLEGVTEIKEYLNKKIEVEGTVEEWQKLAQVIDRLFMVVFFIIQLTTTVGILVTISTADSVPTVQ